MKAGIVVKAIPAGNLLFRSHSLAKGAETFVPPTDEIMAHLASYDIKVVELALGLRSIVLNLAPGVNEILFHNYAFSMIYSYTPKWTGAFCHIVVYTKHVNLGFNRGAELADPEGLLVGDGKIIRHIRIATPEDLKKPQLRRFIGAAIKRSRELAKK